MLDFLDFVTDRGGDPGKIKESQRRRFASETVVNEVLELFEDARRGTAWLVVLRNFVSD
jgi:seryl-tRNA synthetase